MNIKAFVLFQLPSGQYGVDIWNDAAGHGDPDG